MKTIGFLLISKAVDTFYLLSFLFNFCGAPKGGSGVGGFPLLSILGHHHWVKERDSWRRKTRQKRREKDEIFTRSNLVKLSLTPTWTKS